MVVQVNAVYLDKLLILSFKFKLSLMVTLLTGDTLYGKYGFRPIRINRETYSPDDFNIKNYKKIKK